MKKIYLVILLIPLLAISQNVTVTNVKTNDLVYNSTNGLLYVSLSSENGSNSNSIGVLDPINPVLTNAYPVGTNPTVLAISSDGQAIYAGFKNDPVVRKFLTASNTVSTEISLGSDSNNGNYFAEDIVVMPETANTIAVARKNSGYAPKHEGVAIFDDGVMRTKVSAAHSGANQLEWGSANKLVGYNNETTEFGIRKLNVATDGIPTTTRTSLEQVKGNLTFKIFNNVAYFSNGKVVNTEFTPIYVGTFENVNGPMVYDANTEMIIYADYNIITGEITLKHFNSTSLALDHSFPITQVSGVVKNIITCGNGCYALNTADNVVVIQNFLGIGTFASGETLAMYPNPANEILHIASSKQISNVSICNSLGQVIYNIVFSKASDLDIDVSHLTSGTYFVRIRDDHSETTKKLIKL